MNIYEKLLNIQNELKAPKSQYNSFGKYNYRNAEDILEAVKPLCLKYKALCFLTDTIKVVGDRYYVEATAKLVDCEKAEDIIIVTASAREEEEKKGMDGSQVTGASSSYARKYALNGLFDIDDTKDSDYTNKGEEKGQQGTKDKKLIDNPITLEQALKYPTTYQGKKCTLGDLSDEALRKGMTCDNELGKCCKIILKDRALKSIKEQDEQV